jgi:hypothetical protein
MTSFAFILGVVPLVAAHGAGSEMRRSLGVAVFSGMLGVTLFGVFMTPVFYYVLQRFGGLPVRPGAAHPATPITSPPIPGVGPQTDHAPVTIESAKHGGAAGAEGNWSP